MNADQVVKRGRRKSEALMGDVCRVTRIDPDGVPVVNPDGSTSFPRTVVWGPGVPDASGGRCKVTSGQSANVSDTPTVGGHAYLVEQQMVHLPVSSQCRPDDEVEILECDLDPDLVGLTFRLSEQPRGRFKTADRWSVDLVTR